MSVKKSVKSYLTPKEVAELLMVSTAAVRLWAESGDLNARLTAGGHRRFKLDDIKEFATKKNIQLNTKTSENPNILIVDDDIHFAEYLKTLLKIEIKNVEVEISLDGFDAANKLHDFTPNIMLLDLKMPGLDGFQVCQRVKNNPLQSHIRVIAISGDVNQEKIERLQAIGAETCLKKPIDVPALLKHLALS
ncbi:DNA-binding protein [Colwellia sp. 75C3]|uniref:response regulator n=1 Tax=Colwellia sp. 75C3 TaxID=888425 RepID=UPI000C324E62|nr:response regulator [Colwellia sp. 75C3]PKG82166.1 DNA-binding protein [Colwellia sp. 75C3]